MVKRLLISIVLMVLGISFLLFPFMNKMPVLDNKADTYFKDSIAKAGASYAVCRALNAIVSLIKESDIQVEPGGIGLSIASGQILDPLDDMTERLSDVLVTAIVSLGLQKLLYELSIALAPMILAPIFIILSFLVWFKQGRLIYIRRFAIKMVIIVLSARICLPVSSFVDNMLYMHFFEHRITEAKQGLSISPPGARGLKDLTLPRADGVLEAIKNSASYVKQKMKSMKDTLSFITKNLKDIIENLLKLTFLYVGIFAIQVILIPFLIFWFFLKISNTIFSINIPMRAISITNQMVETN